MSKRSMFFTYKENYIFQREQWDPFLHPFSTQRQGNELGQGIIGLRQLGEGLSLYEQSWLLSKHVVNAII